jgi:hypothetical protein
MNALNQLDQALEALRQEHRSIQPPPSLEAAILQQADLATPRPAHSVRNRTIALAAAAALAIAVILFYPRPSHPTIQTRTTPPPRPETTQTPVALNTTITPPIRHRVRAAPRPAARHQNTSDAFVPLPTSEGLPEPTQAMLIRTRIDTSSLRNYGLASPPPGAPQTILAEFLVGEDGLPRAIRLVP